MSSGVTTATWTAQPYGVPIAVHCPEPTLNAALAAVAEPWQAVPADLLLPGPAAVCEATLLPPDCRTAWSEVRWTQSQGRLQVTAGDSWLDADAVLRHARLGLAPDALRSPLWVRWHFLQAAFCWLALQADRTPLHGAGLLWQDRLVLLQGGSGRGKSTTAYAWVQAGGGLLSDEMVVWSTAAGVRAWGHEDRLGVRPEAADWFPELAGVPVERQPTGKLKRLVDLPAPRPLWHSGAVAVVRLEPPGGAPRRTTAAELLMAEAANLPGGYAEHGAALPRLAAALGDSPGWWLPRPATPQATVATLRGLLDGRDA